MHNNIVVILPIPIVTYTTRSIDIAEKAEPLGIERNVCNSTEHYELMCTACDHEKRHTEQQI